MSSQPEASVAGRFGPYGGRYVPETLMHALEELSGVYDAARADTRFWSELDDLLRNYVGRPTPITAVPRLSQQVGAEVVLKREDLNHTGAHKINNTIGQALMAKRMGKPRVIAETGAGQHGVATATVAARYGMECVVSTFVIQSRIDSLVASFSVFVPNSTGRTSAPSRPIRSTLGLWRRMSSAPM